MGGVIDHSDSLPCLAFFRGCGMVSGAVGHLCIYVLAGLYFFLPAQAVSHILELGRPYPFGYLRKSEFLSNSENSFSGVLYSHHFS